MDNGLISFVKMSEADFGSENVWYTPSPQSKPETEIKRWKGRSKKQLQTKRRLSIFIKAAFNDPYIYNY